MPWERPGQTEGEYGAIAEASFQNPSGQRRSSILGVAMHGVYTRYRHRPGMAVAGRQLCTPSHTCCTPRLCAAPGLSIHKARFSREPPLGFRKEPRDLRAACCTLSPHYFFRHRD
uniref:Uncharacterized protein n=1 Tax=Macaca fascicularis TaxID=9541 RepID=A0A7N9CHN6_MACFA